MPPERRLLPPRPRTVARTVLPSRHLPSHHQRTTRPPPPSHAPNLPSAFVAQTTPRGELQPWIDPRLLAKPLAVKTDDLNLQTQSCMSSTKVSVELRTDECRPSTTRSRATLSPRPIFPRQTTPPTWPITILEAAEETRTRAPSAGADATAAAAAATQEETGGRLFRSLPRHRTKCIPLHTCPRTHTNTQRPEANSLHPHQCNSSTQTTSPPP